MYSYEVHIQAGKRYMKFAKRTGATIRKLLHLTKSALESWHREYKQGLDLPMGYARSKPKYSDEQKKVSAPHYLDRNRCLAAILKALGYPCRETVAAWVNELYPETKHSAVGKVQCVLRSRALKTGGCLIELCTR